MRRFMMNRKVPGQPTPLEGVYGLVANGIVFADGLTVIKWLGGKGSLNIYFTDSESTGIQKAEAVHGHGGDTRFEYHDDPEPIVWLCCMCFSDMDIPVNHCFQCGAGGTAVPMSKSQLDMIQRHDKHRLESLAKQTLELQALRRVVYDMYGPEKLGLSIEPSYLEDASEPWVHGVRRGNTVYGTRPKPGEGPSDYLARAAEVAELDPEHVRKMHKLHDPASNHHPACWPTRPGGAK